MFQKKKKIIFNSLTKKINDKFIIIKEGETIPFEQAIKEMEKIKLHTSPFIKLSMINMMNILLKTLSIENDQEMECLTSQEEFYLMVYILIKSNIPNLISQLFLLNDYLHYFGQHENEMKLLNTLKVKLSKIFYITVLLLFFFLVYFCKNINITDLVALINILLVEIFLLFKRLIFFSF